MHLLIITIIIGTGSGREGPQPARGWCGANAILATITSRPSPEFLRALVVLLNLLQRFQTMLPENFFRTFVVAPFATMADADVTKHPLCSAQVAKPTHKTKNHLHVEIKLWPRAQKPLVARSAHTLS